MVCHNMEPVVTWTLCCVGMLAEQMHDLQAAEAHYEQHLALGNAQQAAETAGPDRGAAFANVMKVRCLSMMTACQSIMYSVTLLRTL